MSGLGHQAADTTAVHSLSPTTWLSGVRPKATQGVDAFAGITADQIAAQAIGQDSSLPSMELATEDHSGLIGSCDRDYGCIYMNTLSWRTPTTPLPMEINPRKVFERMFGQGGSAAERVARIQEDRSILDAIAKEAAGLQLQLGPADRQTMTQYLDNVREIERRIQRAEKVQGDEALQLPTRPAGVPFDFEEHVRLMYDLMVLAYQANISRVITFMVSREVSNRTYHAGGRDRRPPRHLAPPEPRRQDGEERPHPDVQRRHVRRVRREAAEDAGRRRHAARQHACCSTAAT